MKLEVNYSASEGYIAQNGCPCIEFISQAVNFPLYKINKMKTCSDISDFCYDWGSENYLRHPAGYLYEVPRLA